MHEEKGRGWANGIREFVNYGIFSRCCGRDGPALRHLGNAPLTLFVVAMVRYAVAVRAQRAEGKE